MGVLVTRHSKPLKDQDARLGAKAGRDRSCGAMRGKEFCPKEKEIQRTERRLVASPGYAAGVQYATLQSRGSPSVCAL